MGISHTIFSGKFQLVGNIVTHLGLMLEGHLLSSVCWLEHNICYVGLVPFHRLRKRQMPETDDPNVNNFAQYSFLQIRSFPVLQLA